MRAKYQIIIVIILSVFFIKALGYNPIKFQKNLTFIVAKELQDSLKKKRRSKPIKELKSINDFEKNEYTYIEDQYAPSCKRLIINNIIDGYTDKPSYNPGDTIKVYLNSNASIFNQKIYLFDVLMNKRDSLNATVFPQSPSTIAPWETYGYGQTFSYIIPLTITSGMYNFGKSIFFIVKSASKNADITIVYPSNTETAYNNAGGKSLYNFNSSSSTKATTVGFQRPLSNFILNEIQQHSYPFLKWLKGLSGYSIQYIQDVDLNDYNEISNSKLIVVIGHSEYWSKAARLNFDKFVHLGNDAAILSGNTMCWQVRYNNDHTKLICHKNSTSDPETDQNLKSILWTDPTLNYSVLKSIGCDWINGAYGMHEYHGYYGYKVLLPNSPLFQGTGLGFHSFLSCQSYEYDATLFSGFDSYGDPILDTNTLGFCKIEILGYDYGHATSATAYSPKGFGTFIAFKKTPASGIIVNSGFNTFTGKTPSYGSGGIYGPDSSKIRTITLNIFSKLLAKQNIFTNPNSCTTSGVKENNYDSGFNSPLIYPNPGKGMFTINTTFKNYNYPKIEIYDCLGKLLFAKELEKTDFNQINLSDLNDGTYFYMLYNDNKIVTRNKLIILR